MTMPLSSPWRFAAIEMRRRISVRLAKDPLIHFLLLGAAAFLVHGLIGLRQERRIVVSKATRSALTAGLTHENGRAPTADELRAAITAWKREEALYREGLRRHLDQNDQVVRRRLVAKVRELTEAFAATPSVDPTEEQLSQFLAWHRSSYEVPVRYDFDQVFIARSDTDGRRRAEQAAADLLAGTDPARLGDPFPNGQTLIGQLIEMVRVVFGDGFANELPKLARGRWTVVASKHGFHVVRLGSVTGGLPPADQLRPRLISDFKQAAMRKAVDDATEAVVAQYRFEEEGGP